MTDDFYRFTDPVDGNTPIDPDIALMSAYLARELNPMQMLSLEERLATDTEFRDAVQPIIDAWAAQLPSLHGAATRRDTSLSMRERTESWQRFRDELSAEQTVGIETHPTVGLTDFPFSTSHNPRRRISMKRLMALLGITVIPVLSFAQAVTYTAAHDDAPGHAIARRIVRSFTRENPLSEPNPRNAGSAQAVSDGPVGRQLHPTAAAYAAAESARLVAGPTSVADSRTASVVRRSPDRRQIAALVGLMQPRLVAGDTAADYAVIVVDAGDNYLWSTIGSGNVSIEVGGDERSDLERLTYNVQHRAEFGDYAAGFAVGRSSVGGDARGGGRSGGGASVVLADTTVIDPLTGEVHRKQTLIPAFDTLIYQKLDSLRRLAFSTPGARGRGALRNDSLLFDRGHGRSYRTVWAEPRGGEAYNHTHGLTSPVPGESGIRGLPAAGVAMSDIYRFERGELVSTAALTVMVVRLTSATAWRGQP